MRTALLTLVALATPLGAAPLPRPPAVTADTLSGATWAYASGPFPNGLITFNADGTYAAVHDRERPDIAFHGSWWVRDGRVRLSECRFDPESGVVYGPNAYEFTLTARPGGLSLAGSTADGMRVALSDPRR